MPHLERFQSLVPGSVIVEGFRRREWGWDIPKDPSNPEHARLLNISRDLTAHRESGTVTPEHSPEPRPGYPHQLSNELNLVLHKQSSLANKSGRESPGMALAGQDRGPAGMD